MAQKQLRATGEMQVTLVRLRDEFGVDVSSALQLQGSELQGWLERAEDTLFLQLLEDLRNERC